MPRTNWVVLKYIFIVSILKYAHLRKYSFVVFAFVNGFPPNTKAVKEPEGHSGLVTILGSVTRTLSFTTYVLGVGPWSLSFSVTLSATT